MRYGEEEQGVLTMTDSLEKSALLSPYPPSFDGNPWSYGFALFSLTLICALSLAMLLHFIFESRARAAAWRMSAVPTPRPVPFASPLAIHRMIITGFLLTILLGAFPDVLLLYAWGEADTSTIDALFLADRICDGMTSFPLLWSAALTAWGAQVVPQQLISSADIQIRAPQWRTIAGQLKIVGMVLIIAAGVTIAKAKAGV